ncbi:MAG: 3-hydroxyacyl-CoA dehydrogenase [Peptoniphilaceae bacterium]|nr:3-hydroxyacyl-CoA dehydrogenase [Peptoniphilaceae bacterium]MDY6018820.1 3-hydroxyacyl-CoA dehydrogenase [Anaerococcus sp.]
MENNKLVVAGGGVLGAQIAFQSAFCGKDVTIWLRSEGSIERAKPRIERLYKVYLGELDNLDKLKGTKSTNFPGGFVDGTENLTEDDIANLKERIEKAHTSIKYELDMGKAVKDAHFIIESVAENIEQKKDFYKKLSEVVEDQTIILSNSSTFQPSYFVEDVKNPERFLCLHFANNIWRGNIGEVMGHDKTNKQAFDATVKFAEEIRMVPVKVNKEQPGYLLNSLLVPFLDAAQELWANDIASPEDIDKAWILGTGAPHGPFQIIDVVGLRTACNIVENNPKSREEGTIENKIVKKFKEKIDRGEIGIEAGHGFYKYN